jgi:Uma2 family endonuclease
MAALTEARMTVDEYLAWAESQPGRYELVNGIVYASPRNGPSTPK